MSEEMKFTLKDIHHLIEGIPNSLTEDDINKIKPIILNIIHKLSEFETGLFKNNKSKCDEIDAMIVDLERYILKRNDESWIDIKKEPEEENVNVVKYLKELQETKLPGFNSNNHTEILQKAIESIQLEADKEKDINIEGDDYIKLLKLTLPDNILNKIKKNKYKIKGEFLENGKYKCTVFNKEGNIACLAIEQTMSEAIILAVDNI